MHLHKRRNKVVNLEFIILFVFLFFFIFVQKVPIEAKDGGPVLLLLQEGGHLKLCSKDW